MKEVFFIYELYIIISIFEIFGAKNEIIFVYEHCRHGSRSPISFHSKNNNKKMIPDLFGTIWTEGNGKLTLRGKIQQYILGIRNRHKYPYLLNYTNYNKNEILVHVNKISRVKDSGYYQLLGMFNPIINDTINNANNKDKYYEINKSYYPPNIKA